MLMERIATIVIILYLSFPGLLFSQVPGSRPNIIVIMADDLGYECLGVNGGLSYATPILDNLAKGGVRFTNCYSLPLCTPSRVQLMTGKYSYRNYVAFEYLKSGEKTFANYLRDAGYATCIAGKWQLNGNEHIEGFEDLDRAYRFGFDEYCLWKYAVPKSEKGERYTAPVYQKNGKLFQGTPDEYGPDLFGDFILDFIDRNKSQPFLVYYPMVLVHAPFLPTPKSSEWQQAALRTQPDTSHFADMVTYMDDAVGRILSHLEKRELLDNTVIIFTADNGTHISITSRTTTQGAYNGGKGTMRNAGTHVPLIVSWKGKIKPNTVTDRLVEFNDFLPTLTDLAGAGLPPDTDGKSLAEFLLTGKGPERAQVLVHYDPLKGGGSERRYGRFVRNKDYKLYNDGSFYRVANDEWEENRLPFDHLSNKEKKLYRKFQSTLDGLPPHAFKQPAEYVKSKTN